MRFELLIIIFIFLNSCKSEKKNSSLKSHNPDSEIVQDFKNRNASELYSKAVENMENGNFEIARKYLKQSFDIEKNSITLNEFGIIARTEKNYTLALKYFNESISLDTKYYPSYINKVLILAKQSNFKAAENTLVEMLLECDSNYWKANANFYLAVIYYDQKEKCEKILKHFNRSKILKDDSVLRQQFLNIEQRIKKYCS